MTHASPPPGSDAVLDVVMPCLDEAAALPWVLGRLPPAARAIVVDDGSRDGSAEIARSLGAVVVHESRRGFGAAAHAGLEAATAPLVAFVDADASLDPAELPALVGAVVSGSARLALGRRRPRSLRAWPLAPRLANAVLLHRVRRATGLRIRDLGPMRVAWRRDLLGLGLQDRRSGYPLEIVLRAAAEGWTVVELDVEYRERTGRSKVTGTIRGAATAVRDMSRLLDGYAR